MKGEGVRIWRIWIVEIVLVEKRMIGKDLGKIMVESDRSVEIVERVIVIKKRKIGN